MSIKSDLIAAFELESLSTKKILERVAFENATWKPHEKSMTFGRLATHIAELPIWINRILVANTYDFATAVFAPNVAKDKQDLMQIFDEHYTNALAALQSVSDESFLDENWKAVRGDTTVSSSSRKVAIQHWSINHIIHHRGQLSVYLRLLNIPVPGLYGPSADEKR